MTAPPPVDRAAMLPWGEFSADARGCTCGYEITVTEIAPRIHSIAVAHDHGCPRSEGRPNDRRRL